MAPVAFALALPAPAPAQIDPGVNYDPASPAGKEYAIPLVLGRAEGAGTEDQQAAANTPFGVGITPPGAGGGGGGRDGGAGQGAGGSGTSGGADPSGGAGGGFEVSPADRGRIVSAEQPADTSLWTLGIALAVLLAAGVFGLALRGERVHPAA